MKRVNIARTVIYCSLGIFFIFTVLLPVVTMLLHITPKGIVSVFSSAQLLKAVRNSVTTAVTATILSLALAMGAAWCMERTAIRLKPFLNLMFTVPMLIPSISHAFGLVALLGSNGLFTNLLGLESGIYGFWGIVFGSVMYSFPVAFLMFSSILRYEDATPYEAAKVLGIPAWNRFTGVSLPYLKKPLISTFFAVFTMIITDYGVPLMIGGKEITLSVLMYNKAVAMIDYGSGSVIGALLLIPAVAAFVIDILNPESGQTGFVSKRILAEKHRARDFTAYFFCIVVLLCVLAPIIAFCIMVFEIKYPVNTTFTLYHIQKTMNRGAGKYLLNSLLYSGLAAVLGTFLAFCCAYITARIKSVFGKALHLISLISMAIPGIVLGLSYVLFFNGSAVYGTILIIVLANSMHFFASPYLMMYNTLVKVNPNLEAVGFSLGIGRLRIIWDVIMVKVRFTIYEMFAYFFVNSMMTISAVSFLAPPSPKPVALMINQFEAQLLLESAAFVSLLILLINFGMKALMHCINNKKILMG